MGDPSGTLRVPCSRYLQQTDEQEKETNLRKKYNHGSYAMNDSLD
jgi:hypothetical protein